MAQFTANIENTQQAQGYSSDPVKQESFDRGIDRAEELVSSTIYHSGRSGVGGSGSEKKTDFYAEQVYKPVRAYADANNLTDEQFKQVLQNTSMDWAVENQVPLSEVKTAMQSGLGIQNPEVLAKSEGSLDAIKKNSEVLQTKQLELENALIEGGNIPQEQARAISKTVQEGIIRNTTTLNNIRQYYQLGRPEDAEREIRAAASNTSNTALKALGQYLQSLPDAKARSEVLENPAMMQSLFVHLSGGNTKVAAIAFRDYSSTVSGLRDAANADVTANLEKQAKMNKALLETLQSTVRRKIAENYPLLALNITGDNIDPALFEKLGQAIKAAGASQDLSQSLGISSEEFQQLIKTTNSGNVTATGANVIYSVINNAPETNNLENSKVAWQGLTIQPDVAATASPKDKEDLSQTTAKTFTKYLLHEYRKNHREYTNKSVVFTTDGNMHVFDEDGKETYDHPLASVINENSAKVEALKKQGFFDTNFFATKMAEGMLYNGGGLPGLPAGVAITPEALQMILSDIPPKEEGLTGTSPVQLTQFAMKKLFNNPSEAIEGVKTGIKQSQSPYPYPMPKESKRTSKLRNVKDYVITPKAPDPQQLKQGKLRTSGEIWYEQLNDKVSELLKNVEVGKKPDKSLLDKAGEVLKELVGIKEARGADMSQAEIERIEEAEIAMQRAFRDSDKNTLTQKDIDSIEEAEIAMQRTFREAEVSRRPLILKDAAGIYDKIARGEKLTAKDIERIEEAEIAMQRTLREYNDGQ